MQPDIKKIEKLITSLQDVTDRFERKEILSFGRYDAIPPPISNCRPCIFGAALLSTGWESDRSIHHNTDALCWYLFNEEYEPISKFFSIPLIVRTRLFILSNANDSIVNWDHPGTRKKLTEAAHRAIESLGEWVEGLRTAP